MGFSNPEKGSGVAAFDPRKLLAVLSRLPAGGRYWVAYSGGCDSHVLLHAMASLAEGLETAVQAVHVHHGLSAAADQWAHHCQTVCRQLSVPLHLLQVDAAPQAGESPEAAARAARYEAIAPLIQTQDCLLTAHHLDDQAETLLLQLLRGGGPHGLAAMSVCSPFAAGILARPLLDFSRSALLVYAREQALSWVDDPSNFDTDIRRNFLRHEIFPRLAKIWPATALAIARSAQHCAEAAALLDSQAVEDLHQVRGPQDCQLVISRLVLLSDARQRNVIRYWCRSLGFSIPQTVHLQHIRQDILHSAADRQPLVNWPGAEIRRYRDLMYLMKPLTAFDPKSVLHWDMQSALSLPAGGGSLEAVSSEAGGLDRGTCRRMRLTVRFRQGGEHCLPVGHRQQKSLKKLLQEAGIPPWQRNCLPLLYVDDQLAAIADLWVCQPFQSDDGQAGLRLRYHPGFALSQ